MPSHRFGFNIKPAGLDPVAIARECARINASTNLVMGDNALAQKLYEQSAGLSVVVARNNWPDDTINIPAVDLVRQWSEWARYHPNLHWYFPNEPVVSGREQLKALLKSCIGLMTRCRDARLKAVIGNFAWGNILYLNDVDAGVWDDFIKAASDWSNAGHGFVGGHDYTWGVLPWGTAKRNPYDMLNPALVQPDKWPTAKEVQDRYADNWLMLRWMMLAKRAEYLGVPMFRMIVTEAPWDRMPNLEVDVEISPGVRRRGVIAEFDLMFPRTRGPLSQRNLFNFWWPQWSREEAAMRQVAWLDDVYPDYVHGFNFFAVNKDWPDYNFWDWPELLPHLYTYRRQSVLDFTKETRLNIMPTGDFDVRFRDAARHGGNIIGSVPKGVWTEVIWYSANEDIYADSYHWRPIRWSGISGFVAMEFLHAEEIPEKPAGIPVPEYLIQNIEDKFVELGTLLSQLRG